MTAMQDAATAHGEMRRQDTNPLPRLEQVHNVDEVVRNLDQIIDWATSLRAPSDTLPCSTSGQRLRYATRSTATSSGNPA